MPRVPPKVQAEIRRRKWRRAATVVLGFFLVVLPFRAVLGDRGWLATSRRKAEVRRLEKETEILRSENDRLTREIGELRRGGHAIERIAREELGMALPGEYVFHFVTPEDAPGHESPHP